MAFAQDGKTAQTGGFFISGSGMQERKTIVYVDGYNLYYSRLRGTSFKWLDLVALFRDHLLVGQDMGQLIKVKYFTACAKADYATHGAAAQKAQQDYHNALRARHPDLFEIVTGKLVVNGNVPKPRYDPDRPIDRADTVRIWTMEEKQTDVSLAVQIYRDVAVGECNQVVLCSNDSDFEPPLRHIRTDFPQARVGVVHPLFPDNADRRVSASLRQQAHWSRRTIRDEELRASQLPELVRKNKKIYTRPEHWRPNPIELLEQLPQSPEAIIPVANEVLPVPEANADAEQIIQIQRPQ
ncbi:MULTISPECIES: NYN domain-containing protein [Burkholderia cepacia complex]|uniref:NYN domain-containing protein n=1 Tax=Burkholderia cepacia complex TaxID=87882 RepID=UPI001E38D4B9|nr:MULTISPECIES: NYN domain-containing protein [Burkholderia cepacia complex]